MPAARGFMDEELDLMNAIAETESVRRQLDMARSELREAHGHIDAQLSQAQGIPRAEDVARKYMDMIARRRSFATALSYDEAMATLSFGNFLTIAADVLEIVRDSRGSKL